MLICYFVPVINSIIPFMVSKEFGAGLKLLMMTVRSTKKVPLNNLRFTLWYGPITAFNFIVMIIVILVVTTRTRSHQLQKSMRLH